MGSGIGETVLDFQDRPQVFKPVEEMPYVIPGTLLAMGMQIGHRGVVQVTLDILLSMYLKPQ